MQRIAAVSLGVAAPQQRAAATAVTPPAAAQWRQAAPAQLRRGRRRGSLAVTAAVQPDRKQEQGVQPAPDAASSKPVNIQMFETMGSEEAVKGGYGEEHPMAAFFASIDFGEPTSFDGEEKTGYDPLRDGPLRYLGYANELGEAFAAWLFNGGVPLSYAVAISYVLFDTYDKWQKTLAEARSKLTGRAAPDSVDLEKLINMIALERGLDTLVWQLIASVAAPGYTIHTVVAAANWALASAEESQQVLAGLGQTAAALGMTSEAFLTTFNKSVPTALGLAAIPFIVHPLDAGVHALLNATLRPAMRSYICQQSGGAEAGLLVCDCDKE